MSETVLRSIRLALASLILTALIAQLVIGMIDNDLTVVRFFSFFTVLSNTMAMVVLAVLAVRTDADSGVKFATIRGAVTSYRAVTGLVWAVVLAPNYVDVAVPEPWIDLSIHVVAPLLMVADWLVNPPRAELGPRVVALWLVFPAVYLVYSLVRGAVVDWYPYPFLDPGGDGDYFGVAIGGLLVAVVCLGFSYLFYWWARRDDEVANAS